MNKTQNHHSETSAAGACALLFPICMLLAFLAPAASAQVHSELWQTHVPGWEWDPETSRLKDFTNAGYMNGNVPIPDWPVGVNVTDFGAVPNDGLDDSQAFMDAIAACPPNHAVLVPNGRYTILQQIAPSRDHFVLRGEDMYGTVLHCPKNLNEIYIQEVGHDPSNPGNRNTGHPKGFFLVEGGTHRSIENLTFEFRDQMKMGHWEHKGADAIGYGDGVVDSWVRNIYLVNADHGVMMKGAQRISFLNMIFDHTIKRPDIIGSSQKFLWVGHIGINMGDASQCLFHNIEFKGKYFHDFDIINVPKNCVVSNVSGVNMDLNHHGQGARNNLYTNVYVGKGDRGLSKLSDANRQQNETLWGIYGDMTLDPASVPQDSVNNHVFVGFDAGLPSSDPSNPNFYYEAIDPLQLHPRNIYLAQLEYLGKPLPDGPPPQPPSVPTNLSDDVIVLNPTDDNRVVPGSPGEVYDPESPSLPFGSYIKFDLNGLDIETISKVRFRINTEKLIRTPITVTLASVADDSWTQDTLTYSNRRDVGPVIASVPVSEDITSKWLEFDLTSHVQNEWNGNKMVSLFIERTPSNAYNGGFRSREMGNAPQLVIERAPSPVAGPPSAPAGISSESLIGNIRLDWEDNPEADVISYNVYRSTTSKSFSTYGEPIAQGLVTSDFVDIDSVGNWKVGMMKSDQIYYYRVTAVDSHGYESVASGEILGTVLDPNSQPPAYADTPVSRANATANVAYSKDMAGAAADPEEDALHFFKVDGPAWLVVGQDGALSGTPGPGDVGLNRFTVQVNSIGGSDQAVVEILVEESNNEPTPPDAPQSLNATPGDGLVILDWDDNSEPDFQSYTVYRALASSGAFTAIGSGLTTSAFTDANATNGITYDYVVTAMDADLDESSNSNVATAMPSAGTTPPANADTHALGGVITNPASWDNGLPVGQLGGIAVDVTADTSIALSGYNILHTAGTILHTGIPALELTNGSSWVTDGATAKTATNFRGFAIKGGSSFTLNQGVIETTNGRDWSVVDAGSSLTVNGGTLNLGRHLLLSGTAGPAFTINGGIVQMTGTSGDIGARSFQGNAKTFHFNGGTTTVYAIDLAGANTVFHFGGTSPGSLTANGITGAIGSNSHLNFLPGTKMSVTLSAADEWAAAQWAAGKLRYNGQGVNELGLWSSVTAPDGLEPGARFAYDSATETLTLDQVDLPPAPPSGLAAIAGDGTIQLQWTASPEPDFATYTVYRSETSGSGYLIIAPDLSETDFEDQGLTNGTAYHYVVTATDTAGNESVFSTQESATPVDLTPPQTPTGLVLFAGDGQILVDWDDNCSCEEDTGLYTVYRNTGGGYEVIASGLSGSNFLSSGLTNGETYSYAVSAVDAAGNESPMSDPQAATPESGLLITSNFLGGLLSDATSWERGLPTDFQGVVATDATADTSVPLSGFNILHTAGTILHTGVPALELTNGSTWVTDGATATTSTNFRGFRISGGSSFTLNQGTIHTVNGKDWYVNDTGSSLTVNGGILNLGRHILLSGAAGPVFTINGGMINGNVTAGDIGGRNFHDDAKAFNFNGGTTTTYRLELAGDNTVFNFGGTSAGSLTAVSFTGTFGANSHLNFLPGSGMSLTLTGSDEWAEALWTSSGLRYNGQDTAQLGTWAAVTATGGLGDGHRFAYDSATETLIVTTAPADDPPAAPTGLAAAAGIGSATLDWADNSESDLASYTVYRSNTAGSIGTAIASGLTDSDHTDSGLEDHATYHYTVIAVDQADQESGPSGQASVTPGTVANYTTAVIDVEGTVSGSVSDVDISDNSYQIITEISDGTTSRLEHVWLFDVASAEVVTFLLEAHHTANSEGDRFVFSYSTDDANYADMLTVTKTSDDGTSGYFTLPSGTSGTVYVRVRDTDRSAGNTALDSIIIDRLVIGSETSSAAPTAASEPSPADGALAVSDSPALSWKAGQGTVSHEVFFGTSPTPESQGTQSGTNFTPGLLLPNTTYYWSVNQTNGSGTTPGPVWSFTTGNVSPRLSTGLIPGVGSEWQTVTLPHTYHSAVVVASVVYADKTVAPAVARIRNVSGNTLELKVQNPSGLPLSGYGVHLVAVEEGTYTASEHGVDMEALKVASTGTNENNNWGSSQQVQLQPANSYTSPVVLGQVMTANDGKWSAFWASSSNRSNPASASSIFVGRHVGEDSDLVRSSETLGVILVESGTGTLDGIAFTAAVGADSVGGIGDSAPYGYALGGLTSATDVAVSSAGMDGVDGGWPVLLGATPVSATQLLLAIDEDQISDAERKHTSEQVSYIVFE